ncbi:sulfate permease [Spizellomyces punctatus DAOM BR117]|uniref:Sulfate permease n=1 Tax=Spizellomyces punctatus (strain DAOM BR117) TaxID=645134 RepID=A0A0L0H8Z5_SPIPD|nr:sulfate permease [Spizellomyces punctatus DAOM BR117]KNC97657.1 sulfate permease [Spizellomyces punctatus DAOM BR117]|eukprot:XP_016605697.1 sulfate permease [Spizellomyces punctatus DAOM BR117]
MGDYKNSFSTSVNLNALERSQRRKTLLHVVDLYSGDVDRSEQPGYARNQQQGRRGPPSILVSPPKEKSLGDKVMGFIPIIEVIRTYNKQLMFGDLRAGLTVGIVLVLRSIVFAQLARVSVIVSLVSSIIPIAIYGLLGTSKQLSVGPEALAAVLIGASVTEELEAGGPGITADQIAAVIAMLVGLTALLLSLMRAGFLDSILTGFMKTGFISSVGLLIMIEQLPELLGIDLTRKPPPTFSSFEKLVATSKAAMQTGHLLTSLIGLAAVVFMVAMRYVKAKTNIAWIKAFPEIVVLVGVMIGISAAIDLKQYGVRTLGTFSNRFPTPAIPPLNMDRMGRLLGGAVAQTVVGFVESMAVSKDLGMQYGYNPKPNRELFALGTANVVGSIFGCFVTMGSLPRSKILADAGGRTNVCSLIAAFWVTVFVLTAGPVLKFLPLSTLAGFVLAAAMSLVHVSEIVFVFKVRSWGEVAGMVAAFCATFFWNIEQGTLIVIFLASILIIRRSVGVDMQILGKVDVSVPVQDRDGQIQQVLQSRYLDVREHPEATLLDDILVISVRSPLLFFNSGNISVAVDKLLKAQKTIAEASGYPSQKGNAGQIIIFDMDGCTAIDAGAMYLMKENIHTFLHLGVKVLFAGITPEQRILFERSGLIEMVGEKNVAPTVEMAALRAETIKMQGY